VEIYAILVERRRNQAIANLGFCIDDRFSFKLTKHNFLSLSINHFRKLTMKFFSAVAVCAMAAIKPVIGQSIVTFQVCSKLYFVSTMKRPTTTTQLHSPFLLRLALPPLMLLGTLKTTNSIMLRSPLTFLIRLVSLTCRQLPKPVRVRQTSLLVLSLEMLKTVR
jgi:hypothetical protein